MTAAGFKQRNVTSASFFTSTKPLRNLCLSVVRSTTSLSQATMLPVLLGLIKKKLMDDYEVTDWERIASFLGVNMDYGLDSGVLTMGVKFKIAKLFEDHSLLNVLKSVKAPTPITEENLNVPSIYQEKWGPVDHYIADKYMRP